MNQLLRMVFYQQANSSIRPVTVTCFTSPNDSMSMESRLLDIEACKHVVYVDIHKIRLRRSDAVFIEG